MVSLDGMAARGHVNGKAYDAVVEGMKSELVPTNQAKLTISSLQISMNSDRTVT